MSGVEEAHFAVLVVRRALARGRELDAVVLSGALDDEAELGRVIPDHLGEVVGPGVDEPGPRARIGIRVERRQPGDPDRRNLAVGELGARKQVRIVESVGGAIAACAAIGIEIDRAGAVRVEREGELVEQRRRQDAVPARGADLVRARPRPLDAVERDELDR